MSIQKTNTAQQNNSTPSFDNSMRFELLNLNDKYTESIDQDFFNGKFGSYWLGGWPD